MSLKFEISRLSFAEIEGWVAIGHWQPHTFEVKLKLPHFSWLFLISRHFLIFILQNIFKLMENSVKFFSLCSLEKKEEY